MVPPDPSLPVNPIALFDIRLVTVALALALALALAWRPQVARAVFRNYFGAKSGPLNLGIFRIAAFTHAFRSAGRTHPEDILGVPTVLRNVAPGWEWIAEGVDLFDPGLVIVVQLTTRVAASLAIVGFGTRLAAPIAALGAVYLFALPNFFTKINHAGHAAMWCALVLAASACGDALSLDSLVRTWRRGRPRLSLQVPPRIAYALPLRWCWLLLGVGYFFAGLAKLWDTGDQWLTGQALTARLSVEGGIGFEPLIPLYEYPALMALTGIGTLVFELGFVFLLLLPPTRVLAAGFGVGFHLGVKYLMGISFMSTLKLYVSFIDFEWLLGRWAHRMPWYVRENLALAGSDLSPSGQPDAPSRDPFLGFVSVAGFVLLLGNAYSGYAGLYSWPFTAFPRFNQRVSTTTPQTCDERMVIRKQSGQRRVVKSHRLRPPINGPRWRYLLNAILAERSKDRRRQLFDASAVLMQAARYDIDPGDEIAIQSVCINRENGKRIRTRKTLAWHRMTITDAGLVP